MGKLPSSLSAVIFCMIYFSGVNSLLDLKFVGSTELADNNTCNVKFVDPGIKETLQRMLADNDHMIFFEFSIDGQTSWDLDSRSEIFQPLKWVRVRGKRGEGLLWLREEFGMLSLTTLNFGIDRLAIELEDSPISCLKSQSMQNISLFIGDLIVHDLDLKPGSALGANWKPTEKVCNKRMRSNNGYMELFYYCCSVDESGSVNCFQKEHDAYIRLLLGCIILLNICAIMYAPLLVPERLYRARNGFNEYEHSLKAKATIRMMKTHKITDPNTKNVLKLSELSDMPNFQKLLTTLKDETAYGLFVDKLYFKVKIDKLIQQNYVPVGIGKNLFNNFVLCNIKDNTVVNGCCTSNIFGSCVYQMQWYKVLREIMVGLFVFSLLGLPWGLRVLIYYCYEKENAERLQLAADTRDLTVTYFGNLTVLLTPLHAVFIISYVLIFLNGLLAVFLRKTITEKFKFTLRKCFRDMREETNFKKMGWAIAVLLKPFEKFGILGFILIPFYWAICIPFVLCILLFYCFPTVNITLRLFVSLIIHFRPKRGVAGQQRTQKKPKALLSDIFEIDRLLPNDNDDRPEILTLAHNLLYFGIVIMSLASIYALIFIIMECYSFLVEVFVYSLVGVILNANYLMKYVSLAVMLIVYAKDTFGSVNKRYLKFNKAILSAAKKMVETDLQLVSLKTDMLQRNTAFQVESEISSSNTRDATDTDDALPVKLVVHNGGLKWRVDRFILFMNDKDIPFIPEDFFFKASHMPCVGCPGPLLKNLLNATASFFKIILFLLFVAIVVGAFGDNISSTNQTLATIVGAILPYAFSNFLFKSPPDLSLDTSNLNFRARFKHVIHNFRQTWPVWDLDEASADLSLNSDVIAEDNPSTENRGSDAHSTNGGTMEVSTLQPNSTSWEIENNVQDFDLIVDMGPLQKQDV